MITRDWSRVFYASLLRIYHARSTISICISGKNNFTLTNPTRWQSAVVRLIRSQEIRSSKDRISRIDIKASQHQGLPRSRWRSRPTEGGFASEETEEDAGSPGQSASSSQDGRSGVSTLKDASALGVSCWISGRRRRRSITARIGSHLSSRQSINAYVYILLLWPSRVPLSRVASTLSDSFRRSSRPTLA